MELVHHCKKKTDPSERGVFQYDEKLKRMVRVRERPKEEGKYAMPLAHYLERKNHLSKGSWKRPEDKEHQLKNQPKDDYGRSGCKDGHGAFHPMLNGKCIYCGLNLGQIKQLHKSDDKEKEKSV